MSTRSAPMRTTACALATCVFLAGCVAYVDQQRRLETVAAVRAAATVVENEEGLQGVAPLELVERIAPAAKIDAFQTRVPWAYELPRLAGMIQLHEVTAGEDLLTISRSMGIGFRALRDANPTIDEWEATER